MRDALQVITDAREETQVLRRNGAGMAPDRVEEILDEIVAAATEYFTWVSEPEAMIRSGHKLPWFRARFAEWERQGHARWNPRNRKERQYRLLIVPLAHDIDAVRAAARRAAQGEKDIAV